MPPLELCSATYHGHPRDPFVAPFFPPLPTLPDLSLRNLNNNNLFTSPLFTLLPPPPILAAPAATRQLRRAPSKTPSLPFPATLALPPLPSQWARG